jgi:hypothetical protein
MSENQNTTATRTLAWATELPNALIPIVDKSVDILREDTLAAGDVAGAERKARAAGVIARTAKAIAALAVIDAAGGDADRAAPQEEDEMDHRDDSPETLQRLRDELESRLNRLRSVLETKGLAVEPGRWPTARTEQEPVRPT